MKCRKTGIAENAPEAMLTVTIPADALTRLLISLETGDVRLAPMQLKTLNVALTNGGLRAENLTVTRDLLVELPAGGCVIDHLSVAEYANITATRCIQPASGWRPRRLHDRCPHG